MKTNSPKKQINHANRNGVIYALLAILATALPGQAGLFVKTNNVSNLNLATSWTNNAVPGSADIAQWDGTVSDVNSTTNTLGANLTWSGIKILNPVAKVQINAGNSLTNGVGGIDMSAATVDLALSNAVCIAPGALQQWNVAPGRTLSLLAVPVKPGQPANNTGVLQVGTTGTVKWTNGAATTIVDNQNNPWVTYGQSDWAALDGSGNVIAATYTTASSAMTAGVFNDITGDIAGGAGSAIDIPGIRFNDSTFHTVSIANSATTRTFTCRGILMTPNCVGATIGGTPTSSFIRPNRVTVANTSWNIIQNSTIGDLTISAMLSDGSSSAPTHLVKSGPGNLILSNPAGGHSGGTDINGGTLTVGAGATSGGGGITVNAGRLIVNASNTTFVARVTINSGATNSIKVNAAAGQQFISTVVFNAGTARCEFNYASGIAPSTTVAPLLVSNVTANGSIALDIYNNSLTVGVYPLIKYTNSLTGTGFGAFALGFMPPHILGYISNDTANVSIDLVVTNVNQPVHWATGNASWDIGSSANWKDTLGNSTIYQQVVTPYSLLGDSVLFGDTDSGSSPITVTLNTAVAPASTTVNATKTYTISGIGSIGGLGGLTKTGAGTLTLGTANSFPGGLALNGGMVVFSSLTNLGGGSISFGGGTLQYNGNSDDISVRTVTLNVTGGTIDTAGNTVNFANPVSSASTGGLTKAGAGTLTLNGTNRYTGNTIVVNGTLALGGNTFISNSPAIIVNSGSIFDVSAVSLTLRGTPIQTLAGSGTINGTIISSNGVITPGTNGVAGTLTFGNDLTVAGGTVVIDLATNTAQRDLIEIGGNLFLYGGTVQLNVTGTLTNGVYKLIHYDGGLNSGSGSSANLLLSGYTQAGKILALTDTLNANEVDLVVSTQGGANTVWQGNVSSDWDIETTLNFTNSSGTPVTFVQGDKPTFDDSSANPNVNLKAALQPGSVTVTANANNYVFSDGTGTGAGKLTGTGGITKNGSSTLTIATANLNSGPTVINGGSVQVGAGGSFGDLGSGNVTNNGALVFYQSDNHSVSGVISGTGPLTQQGSGIVTLSADNTYAGPTTVTAGSLQIGNGGATGSLGSGAITNDGTLIFNRSGSLTVGNIKTGPGNAGALTFSGSAAVTLNSGNTYVNNTAVNGSVVKLAAAENIPSGATVPGSTGWLVLDGGVTGAGALDLNGFNQTVNALSGLGNTVNGVITNSGALATTTNMITVLGTAGTTYNGAINDSVSGSKIGLTLLGASELRLAGNCNYSGPTLVASGATLGVGPGYVNGSGLTVLSNNATFYLDGSSPSVSAGNAIFIQDNSVGVIRSRSTANTMGNAATISGSATATNLVVGNVVSAVTQNVSFNAPATKQFQSFLGTVLITNTETIRFSSTTLSVNGGDNATFEVDAGAFINTRNGSGSTTGNGIYLGALTGAGTISGGGVTVASVTTYYIGGKGIDADFSGTVSDGGAGNTALVKAGAGTQTLDGTLSYTGNTTVNNGVLAIASIANNGTSLDSSPTITVTSNAVLDVSARSDSTLNLGNSIQQTLAGHGIIRGSLFETTTTTNNLTLGVMNITNVATINGALNMQINRTNAPNCSELAAHSFVNGGSITLTVANVGPTNLAAGDTFQLFDQPFPGAFVVTNLPVLPAPQLYWTNKIALNGSIAVASTVNTSPTNITVSVSGSTLTLTWPTDHIGWTLQAQTNNITTGLVTNASAWFDVPTSGNSYSTTIDPTKPTVFYRMKH